ncbi:MAG TPA: hypothetical protein VFY91_03095 [Microbacterium sp.]|nr:hypothetical protein [Microbacterium sp.]
MTVAQSHLDELWDFADPVGSESRLRAAVQREADPSTRAELGTQVARALGLQKRFEEADAVLDAVTPEGSAAVVRTALERGRLRNSAGNADAAIPFFRAAADGASRAGLLFLEVDALHMLAIADPERSEAWTDAALDVLERTQDPRTLRWRVTLHSNAGWSLFDAGRLPDALARFEAARDAAARWGTPEQVTWAEEALAEVGTAASEQE